VGRWPNLRRTGGTRCQGGVTREHERARSTAGVRAVGGGHRRARHGKFLDLDWRGLHRHAPVPGRLVRWHDSRPRAPKPTGKGPIALRVHLDRGGAGFDLTGRDQKRLAVYVLTIRRRCPVCPARPDALDLTPPAWPTLAGARGGSELIGDQSVLAGVGNAYSDEICTSPASVRRRRPPRDAKLDALHTAPQVLADAVTRYGEPGRDNPARLKAKASGAMHARTSCLPAAGHVREGLATVCPVCPTVQTVQPLADRRLSDWFDKPA